MKKVKKMSFAFAVLAVIAVTGCRNPISEGGGDVKEQNLSPTVSFSSAVPKDASLSFQADVEVYSSNNRNTAPPELINSYRLSVKEIDDLVYTRIDMSGDKFPDGKARAMISDGMVMRYIDIESNTTIARMNLSDDDVLNRLAADLPRTRSLSEYYGNADVPALINHFRTLSFDLAEEEGGSGLSVALPASYMTKLTRPGFNYRSAKLYYDVDSDAYAGGDVVIELEDGAVMTSITRPVYETVDGVLIKVGEINQKIYNYPETEEVFETDIPVVDDPESLEVITQEELDELAADGASITPSELIVGDPSDPDYTITEVSVYNEIKVNTLEDSVFRIAE